MKNFLTGMKLTTLLTTLFLPIISFAQNYRFNNYNGYGHTETGGVVLPFILVLLIPIIWIALCILFFVFWLMMLIDAIKNAPKDMKLVWIIVIIFTNIIGAIVYYFVEKRKKKIHKIETKKEEIKG